MMTSHSVTEQAADAIECRITAPLAAWPKLQALRAKLGPAVAGQKSRSVTAATVYTTMFVARTRWRLHGRLCGPAVAGVRQAWIK